MICPQAPASSPDNPQMVDPLSRKAAFKVLGVRVDAVQIPNVVAQMEEWISTRNSSYYVSASNVYGVMEALHDVSFKEVLNSADLSVPDGMPLVWLGRLRGHPLKRRVYGPDLLLDFCRETQQRGYGHFFYGGSSLVVEKLAAELKGYFPGIRVVGTYSPPFRPLTEEEDG